MSNRKNRDNRDIGFTGYLNCSNGDTPALVEGKKKNLTIEELKLIKMGGFITLDKLSPVSVGIQNCYNYLERKHKKELDMIVVVSEEKFKPMKNVDYRRLDDSSQNYRQIDFQKICDENPRTRNQSLEKILG